MSRSLILLHIGIIWRTINLFIENKNTLTKMNSKSKLSNSKNKLSPLSDFQQSHSFSPFPSPPKTSTITNAPILNP
ncbi:hypothetical protein DFP94_104182 [Fontibacillus phaseoli]|uniref:Uncharacterized protein n=1 Tax=Fontibacillus phaseoli TaxID=1416533 RepID=A0A369BGK2_9BACL|nr:hypothetical protein DFP94_104182 [Fontibacillus phaseoli]